MLENMERGTQLCVELDLAQNNTLYSGQKVNCFARFFCSISLVPCRKQDACFGIFVLFCTPFLLFSLSFRLVLWSNYNVVDPSSVFFISQRLNSATVLKSPLASWWNPWAVSFLSGNWVMKDACIFVVTGCIDTPSKVSLITSPCLKAYSMSAFYFLPIYCTNRCPSLRGIGKPPWSLWFNLCLKFTARLRDLTDNCMCGVQRWCSHSKIMLNTVSPCNLLCDLLSKCLILNLFRHPITKGLNTYWLKRHFRFSYFFSYFLKTR